MHLGVEIACRPRQARQFEAIAKTLQARFPESVEEVYTGELDETHVLVGMICNDPFTAGSLMECSNWEALTFLAPDCSRDITEFGGGQLVGGSIQIPPAGVFRKFRQS